ncbi:Uncharacterized conserved protein [Phaffia rhodozyma]|uniref:rRNA-processing protein EFG1 n=1 Tax=Phaffia rhodozyma TaxID=264483 RepID=A0A0F7SME9_PHARH|nr:Uncharacterized conserved protein [Phaffia rhodozyma]
MSFNRQPGSSSAHRGKPRNNRPPHVGIAPGSAGSSSTTQQEGEKKPKKFYHRPTAEEIAVEKAKKEGAELGANKLKANLRQAKRLLARDNIPADVRTETERKVKSIEADLEKALSKNDEKKNAAKYHMVKFFERQKLIRRLKPLTKKLSSDSPAEGSKELSKLQKDILDIRVGLNYVLNYPNSQKYISLFPRSTSSAQTGAQSDDENEADDGKVAPQLSKPASKSKGKSTSSDETDTKRWELLEKIRGLMLDGTLPAEPEDAVLHSDQTPSGSSKRKRTGLESLDGSKKTKSSVEEKEPEGIEGDDFFGGDE